MPFNMQVTKALVLTGLLALVAIFTLNKIIQNNRLEIFQKYSNLVLPPAYEIKQNTAGTSSNRNDVLIVFEFDKRNFDLFIRQNKIDTIGSSNPNQWQSQGLALRRKLNIDSQTTVVEKIYPAQQWLEFRFTQ